MVRLVAYETMWNIEIRWQCHRFEFEWQHRRVWMIIFTFNEIQTIVLHLRRYAKDIILAIVIAQSASLIHRYLWWLLSAVRIFSSYALIYVDLVFRFHFMRSIKDSCCISFRRMLNYVVVIRTNKVMPKKVEKPKSPESLDISQKKTSLLFVFLYLFIQYQ